MRDWPTCTKLWNWPPAIPARITIWVWHSCIAASMTRRPRISPRRSGPCPDGWENQYDPVDMRYNLGQALLLQGKPQAAGAALSEVVALDPNHAQAHYQLARVLAESDDARGALKHYAAAMKVDSRVDTSAVLHHMLATYYLNDRVFDRALAHERRALALARACGEQASGDSGD